MKKFYFDWGLRMTLFFIGEVLFIVVYILGKAIQCYVIFIVNNFEFVCIIILRET